MNLDLLNDQDHLSHFLQEERHIVLDTFLRSTILAVPGARKNSMFGFNPPAFVLGLRRRGQPLSLVNAFEKPIMPSAAGYVEPSIAAIKSHLASLRAVYGLPAEVEACIPDTGIDSFISCLLGASDDTEA
jgi:CRISPR system Cascade subunit CasC